MFKKIHYFLCFAIFFAACSEKRNSNYYNLDFQKQWIDGWINEINMGRLYHDSTIAINGNIPLCIDNENIKKGNIIIRRFTLNYSLGRKISLPEIKDAKKIEVSINYKSLNLEKAWLKIYSADKNGKLLNECSKEMYNTKKWTSIKINIPDNHAKHLYVYIITTSNELIRKTKDIIIEKNINQPLDSTWMFFPVQKFWIDKVKIRIDNFDMADFLPDMMQTPELGGKYLTPLNLSNENTFSQIIELKDKKIIGIGESAHTTNEFPQIAYSFIKYRILHNNCKLVILELPFSLGLKLNIFVQKETLFDIKEIEDILRPSMIPSDELIDFLLWLKKYNQTTEHKVNIVAMGVEESVLNKDILAFINEYIQTDSSLFAPVFRNISMGKNTEAWNKIFRNKECFGKILGEGITNLLMHGLKHPFPMLKLGAENRYILSERDSLMHDRVNIAITNLLENDETAVIYAHLGHTTKSEVWMPRFIPSVGKYLSDTWADKYFSIGLITYSEKIDSVRYNAESDFIGTFWNTQIAFSPAPLYSLEAACEKTKIPLFYASTSSLPATVLLRHSGLFMFDGKFDYYPIKGMDAFVFVSRVTKKYI